ncbi:MAG: bacteriohemerythrin [Pseudomonadota bacterium]
MIAYVKSSLRLKLLLTLVVILTLSFTGLSLYIVARQTSLLGDMSTRVEQGLMEAGNKSQADFRQMEENVTGILTVMKETVSSDLSKATETALSEEEARLKKTMERFLETNGNALVSLLNSVAPGLIMGEALDDLVKYSRAAAQTSEIVYALFLDKNGKTLPGYINLVDDRIIGYLNSPGNEEDIAKVIARSKQDPGVLIIEKTIEYYGLPIGTTLVCLSRKAVDEEIKALGERFKNLKQSNEGRVTTALDGESSKVMAAIGSNLAGVGKSNEQSIRETASLLSTSAAQVNTSIKTIIAGVGTVCSIVILILMAVFFKIMVINPIRTISEGLKDTAQGEGDLTKRLKSDRTDEIGILAGWFDAFLERLNNIIVDIRENAETVTAASGEVLTVAEDMGQGADELSSRSNSVAAAAEEMSANMHSVAAASEQASINVGVVSDAAVQMKDTLNEVAMSCEKARSVADSASAKVASATGKVGELGEAAKEISKVTEVITEIAEQTNLLALNATIEAARAGEAGKGFAVVASEIKSLAAQTGKATLDIREKIQGIQNSTDETIREVATISEVIVDVNEIVSTIAAAIEEQSAAASQVAENIGQASQGIGEVNENVAQSSQVASEIAKDITEVNGVAGSMFKRSSQMKVSAQDLSDLAKVLRDMISVFKVSQEKIGVGAAAGKTVAQEPAGEVPDLMTWGPKLETGLKEIDSQHRKLVGMINSLHRAMKLKKGAKESGRILDELAQYTVFHFGHEETLFDKHGYPDTGEHKKIHKALVKQVTDFQSGFNKGQATLSMDLMDFLKDWLKNHIMKTDMAYVPFFKSKGM